MYGGVWRCMEVYGGVWWGVVGCGSVWRGVNPRIEKIENHQNYDNCLNDQNLVISWAFYCSLLHSNIVPTCFKGSFRVFKHTVNFFDFFDR